MADDDNDRKIIDFASRAKKRHGAPNPSVDTIFNTFFDGSTSLIRKEIKELLPIYDVIPSDLLAELKINRVQIIEHLKEAANLEGELLACIAVEMIHGSDAYRLLHAYKPERYPRPKDITLRTIKDALITHYEGAGLPAAERRLQETINMMRRTVKHLALRGRSQLTIYQSF